MTENNTNSQKGEGLYGNPIGFAAEMKKLVNKSEYSDIKFIVGDTKQMIYAHRSILSARCDVFDTMFHDNSVAIENNDVPYILSDVQPDSFLAVLEFIYTNCCSLTDKNVVDVLASAIEYGLRDLAKICVNFMSDSITIDNACETMQSAVTYGQAELQKKCLSFIESNTKAVFKTKGFHEMSDEALAVALASNNLNIDEVDIIKAVREWATVNSVVLDKKVSEVAFGIIKHIRLPLLTPEELTVVEADNKADRLIPIEHISYAWRYHALKKKEAGNPLTTKRSGTKPRPNYS
ncbi:BTB/POZ domain-containing protein 19 [Trichoplax sp. H2]|uniref:BTB domain-containing protein n=1 Tax=Trichoplax adhaerens TaxID=10228 RepID=B3S2H5_TRIAD|nr:hypothetical protein TRIADDRAFT_58027 [Trichoplax adhaerens]EDV23421.1 hypothetical protein TRIADDRAFT_58027 [Trichoplax adhaerens]RDD47935.1 BTB/POZ domain-containing protein 19 [Trichoplax sp. H2]|eukprot:XP_002114331.1 hypothetical protein TRIADDRAFT_58027 [Trichoplax adhaerens]